MDPIKMMTYDSSGNPLCDSSGTQGLINFPCTIKLSTASGTQSKAMHYEGVSELMLTFKKNDFPAVSVCQDGASKFPGFPDSWWLVHVMI